MLSFITERRQVLPVSVPLEYFGIDYDKLTKEQFVSLIEILKLSRYLKAPSTSAEKHDRSYRTEKAKRNANKKKSAPAF